MHARVLRGGLIRDRPYRRIDARASPFWRSWGKTLLGGLLPAVKPWLQHEQPQCDADKDPELEVVRWAFQRRDPCDYKPAADHEGKKKQRPTDPIHGEWGSSQLAAAR